MIQPDRIRPLGGESSIRTRGRDFVLYWMQASQRAADNHALEFAADRANESGKPLVVYFGLTDEFPEANERHFAFLLEGLKETAASLEARGIRMIARLVAPGLGAAALGRRAVLVVVDRGYLRVERKWRADATRGLDCPLIEVESNVVVPVETASGKEEYTAATLRPKIRRLLPDYLVPLAPRLLKKSSLGLRFDSLDLRDTEAVLASLRPSGRARRVAGFRGGASRALERLDDFVENKLDDYPEDRNDPALDGLSNLGPYLHFGQISPLTVALRVREHGGPGAAPYLEELIVRRELAMNFVRYNPGYDRFTGLPEWSRETLRRHAGVPREYVYARTEFEKAKTHDPYWNAAQKEMVATGKMHGYMRMYWGKKILEWSATPEEGFRIALGLNNAWELDGRDPNGFAGVAWCFGKHDRPWPERPIFGKVRYMNAAGLRRKFDAEAYVRRADRLGS
ncbi:MAG: deoxyribodipyrimidine photo-lyase [Candidatus Aminicenantales bacterium]